MKALINSICNFFRKFIIWNVILITGLGPLTGCSDDMFNVNETVSISITSTDPAYKNGIMTFDSLVDAAGLHTLSASVKTRGGDTKTNVKWDVKEAFSGNPTTGIELDQQSPGTLVFQINKVGRYSISAISNDNPDLRASVTVIVSGYLESLAVADDNGTIINVRMEKYQGSSFQLKPVFTPENTTQTNVRWSTDANSILSITPDGLVTPTGTGSAKITLTSTDNPSIGATVELLIKQKISDQTTDGSWIDLSQVEDIEYGETQEILATVRDGFGNSITTGEVSWESSDESVARVSVNESDSRRATISAVGGGNAKITAYFTTGNGNTISSDREVNVINALERISTNSDIYNLPVGYKSQVPDGQGGNDADIIPVLFYPDTVDDKYHGIDITTSNNNISVSEEDGYLIIEALKEGSTTVRLEAESFPGISHEFTVNVRETLSDEDRIMSIALSRNSLTFEPPFTESSLKEVSAYTRVYEDATGGAVNGDASKYPVNALSGDENIATVEKSKDGNTFIITPHNSGETEIVFSSALDENTKTSLPVTVGGHLDAFTFSPSGVNFSVDSKNGQTIKITPYPQNALYHLAGEEGSGSTVDFILSSNNIIALKASHEETGNTVTLTLTPEIPGSVDILVTADGQEMGTIPVTVVAGDDKYPTSFWFTQGSKGGFDEAVGSLSIAQDSDGATLYINAENAEGDILDLTADDYSIEVVSGSRLYRPDSNGTIDFDQAVISVDRESGRITIDQKNAGRFAINALCAENTSAGATISVEVGGAFVHEGLQAIRPYSNYIQVREGDKFDTGVNFVPSDWDNQKTEWSVTDDGEKNVSILYTYDDASATIQGNSAGSDVIAVRAEDKDAQNNDVETSFVVEVVERNRDAWAISLDKSYISFDRNSKEMPTLKASVTKNGNRTETADVIWTLQAVDGNIADLVSLAIEGTAPASRENMVILEDTDETGYLYVTASVASASEVSASCIVEVVDSSTVFTEVSSLNVIDSSMRVKENGGMYYMRYSVLPEKFQNGSLLDFSVSPDNGGLAVMQINDYTIGVIGNKEGEYEVTASLRNSGGFFDSFSVEVYDDVETPVPSYIQLDRPVVNLDQKKMDESVTVTADVYDQFGRKMALEDLEGDFIFEEERGSDSVVTVKKGVQKNQITLTPAGAGYTTITVRYGLLEEVELTVSTGAEDFVYKGPQQVLPSSSHIILEKGKSQEISIQLIPSSGEYDEITWRTDDARLTVTADEDDPRKATVVSGSTLEGAKVWALVSIDGSDSLEAEFTVDVAGDTGGMITGIQVSPQHIMIDRAAKDLTFVSARVYRDGQLVDFTQETDDSALPEFTLSDSLKDLVSVNEAERGTAVLTFTESGQTGSGYLTAEVKQGQASFSARTYIEFVDSSLLESRLEDIVISPQSLVMAEGSSRTLTYTTIPSDIRDSEDFSVTFTSSHPDILTIDRQGVIRALETGSAVITARASYNGSEIVKSVPVTVNEAVEGESVPSYVQASPSVVNLDQMNGSEWSVITVNVYDEYGARIPLEELDGDVEFSFTPASGADRIVKYEEGDEKNQLKVAPLSAGVTSFTARWGTLSPVRITVSVGAEEIIYDEARAIYPSTNNIIIEKGQTFEASVILTPDRGNDVDIRWLSSSAAVKVEADGTDSRKAVITGLDYTDRAQTVTAVLETQRGSLSAEFSVQVVEDTSSMVTGISAQPQYILIDRAAKNIITVKGIVYVDGRAVDFTQADSSQWLPSFTLDEALADILSVEEMSDGTAVLTLKEGNETGEGFLRVKKSDNGTNFETLVRIEVVDTSLLVRELKGLTVSPDSADMLVGQQRQINWQTEPSTIRNTSGFHVSFTSDRPDIASVSNSGLVRAVGEGSAVITVKGIYGETSAEDTFTVTSRFTEEAPSVIRVLDSSLTLNQKDADRWVPIRAEVLDGKGNVIEDAEVTFTPGPDADRYISSMEDADEANTLYVRPSGNAGSTYVEVSYLNLSPVRVIISVGAQEVTFSRDLKALVNADGSDSYIIGGLQSNGVSITLDMIPSSLRDDSYSVEWSADEELTVSRALNDPFTAYVSSNGAAEGEFEVMAQLVRNGASVSGMTKTFPVKVVPDDEYSSSITHIAVRPVYISYDRDAKAFTDIKATVYRGGKAVSDQGLVSYAWSDDSEIGEDDIAVTTDSHNNAAVLTPGVNTDTTGEGVIRATALVKDDFAITASTFVEIVKSSTMDAGLRGIYLNQSSVVIEKGQTYQISLITNPASAASKPGFSVEYESANSSIVSVSEDGLVSALREGSAYVNITASYQNGSYDDIYSTRLYVTVDEESLETPSYISLSRGLVELDQMESEKLVPVTATVYSNNGAMNAEVKWSIGNSQIVDAEVSGNTIYLSPLSAGRTSATATYEKDGNSVSAQVIIVVGEGKTVSGEITGLIPSVNGEIDLYNGNSEGMNIWVIPQGGSDGEIEWSASSSAGLDIPLTVTANDDNSFYAVVKPVEGKTGNAVVTARLKGNAEISASFVFSVNADRTWLVSAVSISPSSLVLDMEGKDLPVLRATLYADGYEVSDAELAAQDKAVEVSWSIEDDDQGALNVTPFGSSSLQAMIGVDTAKATDSQDSRIAAKVTGDVKPGDDVYSKGIISLVFSSRIKTSLKDISVSLSESIHIAEGESIQFSLSAVPAAITGDVEWSYSVEQENGVTGEIYVYNNTITALSSAPSPAVLKITGTYTDEDKVESSVTKEIKVYVDRKTDTTTTMQLSQMTVELEKAGDAAVVNVSVFNRSGNEITGEKMFSWSVDNPDIASISESSSDKDGNKDIVVVTARGEGSTRFTVRDNSMSTSGYIIVGEAGELVGITTSPSQIVMAVNESVSVNLSPSPSSFTDRTAFSISSVSKNIRLLDEDGNPLADDAKITAYDTFRIAGVREGLAPVSVTAWLKDDAGQYTVSTSVSTVIQMRVSGQAEAERIVFDKGSVEIAAGQSEADITATIISSTGREYNGIVSWSIDDESIAVIDDAKSTGNTAYVRPVNAGSTILNASFEGIRSSVNVSYNNYGVSDAKSPADMIASPSTIVLYHPGTSSTDPVEDAAIQAAKSAEVSIVYYPAGLKDEYKGLVISNDNPSVAQAVLNPDKTGSITVTAKDEGKAVIRVTSTIDSTVAASFTVNVLEEGMIIDGGIPQLSLSPKSTTLDLGEKALLTAVLRNDEGYMDAGEDELEWSHSNPDAFTLDTPVNGNAAQAEVTALATGRDTVSVSYAISDDIVISDSVSVSGTSTSTIGSQLRSVGWAYSALTLVTGQEKTLQYSIQPDQAEYDVAFSIANTDADPDVPAVLERVEGTAGNVIKVRAVNAGSAVVTVTVTDRINNVTKSADLSVSVTNGIRESAKFSTLSASRGSITMGMNDDPTQLSYSLMGTDGKEDVSTPVTAFKVYGEGGQLLQTITLEEMRKAAEDPVNNVIDQENNSLFKIMALGSLDNRTFTITPLTSGEAYLEAYVYDDGTGADQSKGVLARTYINITGRVKGVGISTMYMRVAEGEAFTVNVDTSPSGALANRLYGKWSAGDDLIVAGGTIVSNDNPLISVTGENSRSISLLAKERGEVTLKYEYNDGGWNEDGSAKDGTKKSLTAEVVINILSPDEMMGGARMIEFPQGFYDFAMPYTETKITPVITYFDGSQSSTESRGENITYRAYVEDASKTDESQMTTAEGIYVSMRRDADGSVLVKPLKSGTVRLVATYTDPAGGTCSAKTLLNISGPVNSITLSNSAMVIYTGGSAVVSAGADSDAYDDFNFQWRLVSEKKAAGSADNRTWELIDSATDRSVFETIINNASNGSEIVIGAKDVIFDKNDPAYGNAENFGLTAETFPRQGTFEVYSPEDPQVKATLIVTVEMLPEENTYPKTLSLSESRLAIEPNEEGGFDSNSEIEAVVTDRNGTEIPATIQWYYYPIPSASSGQSAIDWDAVKADYNLNTEIVNDGDGALGDIVYAYFENDGQNMLFRPKDSGLYRVKAIVAENPKLQAEATVSVGGKVTSIASDAGARISMVKEETFTVSAILSPSNALQRTVFLIPQSAKGQTDSHSVEGGSGNWNNINENYYLSYVQNGNTFSLYAKNETTSTQVLWLEYWDRDVTDALTAAQSDGVLTVKEYHDATNGKSPLVSPVSVNVDIAPKSKTIVTFSIDGLAESIDPSNVGNAISFNVIATAKGENSGMTFDDWDWVDVDIVGSESGLIYATSRTIDVDENGNAITEATAAGQKKKIALWNYKGFTEDKAANPIAQGGIINRNGNTFSFQLNNEGLATEPMLFRVYLKAEYEDGYAAVREQVDGKWIWQEEGYSPSYVKENGLDPTKDTGTYLFNTDETGFNGGQRLCYIGGRVTGLNYGTTTYNLNNNKTTSEGSNVDMILGASAVLTVTYNPSYTHQKGVLWYVVSNNSFTDFEAMQGGSQCSVFARSAYDGAVIIRAASIYAPWFQTRAEMFDAQYQARGYDGWLEAYLEASDEVHRSAVDDDDPMRYPTTSELGGTSGSMFIDFQITCSSPIEKAVFTAYAQTDISNVSSGGPSTGTYEFLPEDNFPPSTSTNQIWCFDNSGVSGDSSGETTEAPTGVDAYFITTDVEPVYGYNLDFSIVSGSEIGYLDNNEIDASSNSFRFVPNGPRKDVTGTSTTTAYGDVVIQAKNTALNFSKNFVLHYQPSSFKLVKYIGQDSEGKPAYLNDDGSPVFKTGGTDWNRGLVYENTSINGEESGWWDIYGNESAGIEIKALEALVLYPGEEFPLSVISFYKSSDGAEPNYITESATTVEKEIVGWQDNDGDGVAETPVYEEAVSTQKYAIRYSVQRTSGITSNVEENLMTDWLYFDNGSMSADEWETNSPSLYAGSANGKSTGVSRWYYDSELTGDGKGNGAKNVITAGDKQGAVYLQYSICPLVEVDKSGGKTEWQADISQIQTNGLWVFIVSPADQMTARFIDYTDNNGATGLLSHLIPFKISAGNRKAVSAEGTEMPDHWYMGDRGAVKEPALIDGIDVGVTFARGRAYALFSESPRNLDNFTSKFTDHRNNEWVKPALVTSARRLEISSSQLSKVNEHPPVITDEMQETLLAKSAGYEDLGVFCDEQGNGGLNLFTGIKELEIDEDGDLTQAYFLDGRGASITGGVITAERNLVFDFSAWDLEKFTHHGMWRSGLAGHIAEYYPPHAVEELDLSGNGFESEGENEYMRVRVGNSMVPSAFHAAIIWNGRYMKNGVSYSYDIRNTLRKLDLSYTDIKDLTLDNFTQLSVLDVSNSTGCDNSSGSDSGSLKFYFTGGKKSNLLQLWADGTTFRNISAAFKEGTREEYLAVRDIESLLAHSEKTVDGERVTVYSEPSSSSAGDIFADAWKRSVTYSDGSKDEMFSIFSARYRGTSASTSNVKLENIQLSGGIGYVDVAGALYLRSLTIGSGLDINDPDAFIYDDSRYATDWVQIVNIGGSTAEPDMSTYGYNIEAMLEGFEDSADAEEHDFILAATDVIGWPTGYFATLRLGTVGTVLSSIEGTVSSRPYLKNFSISRVDGLGRRLERISGTREYIENASLGADLMLNRMTGLSDIVIDYVCEGSSVRMQETSAKEINIQNMYGRLDFSSSPSIVRAVINTDMSGSVPPEDSAVILDGTGIANLTDVLAFVEEVSLNNCVSLDEVRVSGGKATNDYTGVWKKLSSSNVHDMFSQPSGMKVRTVSVASSAALEELYCYGHGDGSPRYDNGVQSVNLQGLKLRVIDLHSDDLYKIRWNIGDFTYVPVKAGNNLDGYWGTSDGEYLYGNQMNELLYDSMKFIIHGIAYTSDETGKRNYYLDMDSEVKKVQGGDQTLIDWTDWGLSLAEPDAKLIMYGNAINWQWHTGVGYNLGQATDSHILKNRPTIVLPDGTERDIQDVESFTFTVDENGVAKEVTLSLNWRSIPLTQGTQDGHKDDQFQVRFGTFTDDFYDDSQYSALILHNKYKEGGDGLWGIGAAENSSGSLSMIKAWDQEGREMKLNGSTLHWVDFIGAQTWEIELNDSYKFTCGTSYKVSIQDSSGKDVDPSNMLIRYKLYDENTKWYGHDAAAVVFPFGK